MTVLLHGCGLTATVITLVTATAVLDDISTMILFGAKGWKFNNGDSGVETGMDRIYQPGIAQIQEKYD